MKILKSKRGAFALESMAMLFLSLLVFAVAIRIIPVLSAKQQLDTYAGELRRTAENTGCVGTETTERSGELTDNTGLKPEIAWSQTGKIQQGQEFTVTCTVTKNIGLWGGFGSFPITLTSRASGKSEVYWK